MISLPKTTEDLLRADWSTFEPYAQELLNRSLMSDSAEEWLADWSELERCLDELYNRLMIAVDQNTADEQRKEHYEEFIDRTFPAYQEMEQKLKTKLLTCGLSPDNFQIPLRNIQSEANLFRSENLPLFAEEAKLASEYGRITGSQTVQWEGKEKTLSQMSTIGQDPDREKRERAWRLTTQRQLQDRQGLNGLWQKLLTTRNQLAKNAGKANYRDFRWQQLLRFDYTPADCESFHAAIEEAVVPAMQRIYERRRKQLGVDKLRPWDLDVDSLGREPLRPYQTFDELEGKISAIFGQLDPKFGEYFTILSREKLLDLDNRKNKAPGAYCNPLMKTRKPFIFLNAVGLHGDVQTLLHEGGHAVHAFEAFELPYYPQLMVPMEFAEVASMSMELLAAPYLTQDKGGFYTSQQAARARIEHLEKNILFWPYMAVVDGFQHWAYTNATLSMDPQECDQAWAGLWKRFMGGVDWSGLEDEMMTGWHRKLHIFLAPLYYVEYGLAQLGATQIWANSLKDQKSAVAAYRQALSLGYTRSLPELYRTAGAHLAFDAATLREAVGLTERVIEELQAQA
jgi:oligoendopeptidase F